MNQMNELNRYILEQTKNDQLNEDIASEILFKVNQTGNEPNQAIAIVGIACRFAGALNANQYWDNLKKREYCIGEFPAERLRNLGIDPRQKSQFAIGGYFSEIDQFDAGFFKISPKEAMLMAPTQRILLETAYQAIEDGGYGDISALNPKTGVYIGVDSTTLSQYRNLITEQDFFTTTGSVTGILAGRISHIFNLRGPNMVIDTACSSGLVAVHEACKALVNKECELAIAGGININIIPPKRTEQNEITADDGVIRPFDKSAKGTVWGEGVGVLLLKPLPQALNDRDSIYAIIRGSAVNNDGASNGLTAPNADAQEELLRRAWEVAGVNPETISYIEAHGTGTVLGDPIEIKGLTNAFKRYTTAKQFCGIGSVKSNIGHTVGASGIASLLKVVLALKNKEIPASINFAAPNPHIDFINSPVYVMESLQPWHSPNTPRRAGITTYGFSGTNCHVVLEEAPNIGKEERSAQAPYYLLALSAKTGEALLGKVRDMIEALEKEATGDLARISYTLFKGRQHFNHRCAIVVQDKLEAIKGLKQLERDEKSPNLFQGKVLRDFTGQKVIAQYAEELLEQSRTLQENKSKYQEILFALADFYCQGYQMDWNSLFGGNKPKRVNLPTYPFAREHYWIPETDTKGNGVINTATNTGITTYIHPLLQQNTSDLSEQRYSSTFTGREFFLADHVIRSKKVLPGVAYLEMARAAVEMAAGNLIEGRQVLKLNNVVWARPIIIDGEPIQIHIGLYPGDNGEIAYEIYSLMENGKEEAVVYSQGSARLTVVAENPVLDLKVLQAECNQQKVSGPEIYKIFKTTGFDYGPRHQGIETIYVGKDFVLAKLSLPPSIAGTEAEFVLHPSIMDAALQASIGMEDGVLESMAAPKPSLPFALQELEIYRRCTGSMWANIQYSKDNTASDKLQKLDIDICDEQGNVCVRLKGFTSRVLEGGIGKTGPAPSTGSLLLDPVWKEQAVLYSDGPIDVQMKQESGTVADQDLLREKVSNYLKKLLSPVIKLSVERIEADIPMENYGINSIMVMELTNQLEKTFGSLSKTLFFEYQTIRELSGYFLKSYREQLNQLIGIEKKEEITKDTGTAITSGPLMPVIRSHKRSRFITPQPIQESKPNRPLDIAIIGLSGRYPQARNLQEFWKNLRDGKDCITEIPKDRWDHSQYFDEDKNKPGKTYSKWGGFIDGVDQFDPLFFNISPLEAELMDPQERLFLECVYATLEDAGYTGESLAKGQNSTVGVYVGVMYDEYQLYGAQGQVQGFPIAISGNPSDIANRVSYFCNFHGPSMAVDTMCSSSLTTIHLACQSLQQGICELAIAGGVNVSIHPNKYLVLGQARFVSSTGRCESFGKGGDGYVPGEGVGAVLLKPLSKAIADGDHIYGVIKGTAINHGGKTNGYTVPNPNAQAGVIGQALKEAGSDPRTISYIEAHGTGTFLGDPIEITGLVKAFQKYTENKQFCTIGSAKSNIGHCESAAGIAGVTKVLLQLKNRQIAPSLHSEVLNPNIDFLNTPFIVQQQLTEWERPVVTIDGVTREYPRIAGISSFGAGGSNAHIIIEEYIPKSQEQAAVTETPQQPALIILSAKDEERLKEQAERLIAAIRERRLTDANLANSYLADIAYTLQVGREAMEERLGVIAGSTGELIEKLTAFLTGQNGIEDLYRGQVKRNQEALTVFTADEEMQEAIQKWIERKKYGKLLDLWVKGLIFDWNKLYGDQKPRRISLPTYPFAKERYWVPEMKTKRTLAPNSGIATYIHPLLQQNTSDFLEQRFSSTFTGKEFFLADHVVNGQKVLPGVAYLEMVRAAVEAAATGGLANDRMMIKLKNVIWARPIGVGEQPAQVHIGLYPEDDAFSENGSGEINYEIYDATGTEDGMPLVYSQGRAILTTAPELPVLDLKAVQAECGERILQATEVYETYRAMGIEYGPGHRGIEEIYIGPEQVLARLLLPSTITETQEQFVLHPSIMDAALQASIGLETSFEDRYLLEGKGVKPMLPFALEELEIIGRCTSSMWALIRHSEGNNKGDKVRKLDIDLCDDQGHICVRLKGFSSRVLEREIPIASRRRPVSVENTSELQVGTIMLTPAWETVSMKRVETSPTLSDRVVIVGGTKEQKSNIQKQYPNVAVLEIQTSDSIDEITRKLTEYGTINHILWIAPYRKLKSSADEILIKEQNQGVLQVFKIIKALLKLGYGTRELGWSLITNRTQAVHKNDEVNPTHASLSGLAGSMAKEYPDWKIRLMDLETEAWPNFSDIFTLPPDTSGNALAFRGGEWYQQQLIPVQSIPIKQTLYKTGGVYVVIGGAGGIGEAWSEYVIRTYQAQVIWIGRRAKDEAIQAKIDRLATLGPEPQYIAADATKRKALEEAYHEIKQSYLQINGVVHSAIVLLDKSLMNMTEEQFQTVLSAKVDVSVRMAQVFSEEPLDFVMFFSSMESFSKSAGQSNYAAGCTFKDAFAHRLNLEWPSTVKVMNWGYWGNVGIVASKVYQELMAQAGIGSIEPPEAMDALERLLAGPLDQIALMKTIKPLTLEGTNQEKQITIYPESLPSVIGNIDNHPIISD